MWLAGGAQHQELFYSFSVGQIISKGRYSVQSTIKQLLSSDEAQKLQGERTAKCCIAQ